MAKKIPTTDDARKTKLPSGTKGRSTQASVNEAAKKAICSPALYAELKPIIEKNTINIVKYFFISPP